MEIRSVYTFDLFDDKQLVHGISTRSFGSMKKRGNLEKKNINRFVHTLKNTAMSVVMGEQVHGGEVAIADGSQDVYPGVDGLVTTRKNVMLGIVTADCVPILLYDKKRRIVGAMHAGYKGILAGVIENTLIKMNEAGAKNEDILVGIGPAIGACCYDVTKDRIHAFTKTLSDAIVFEKREGKYFLKLYDIVQVKLVALGIQKKNIEVISLCTKDNRDLFYSYRGEGVDSYGEFISVIGMI